MGRLGTLLGAAALTVGLVAGTAGTAGAARSPFTGQWTSTDIDGSNQRLSIGGGPSPRLQLYDDGATVCNPDLSIAARARGAGAVSGASVSVDFDVYCLTMPTTFELTAPFSFTYDAATDTLTDSTGVVWSRRGA